MTSWYLISPATASDPTAIVDRLVEVLQTHPAPDAGLDSSTVGILAVVATITVAFLTHAFTRSREASSWEKEQLFDVIKSLSKAERKIDEEFIKAPLADARPYEETVELYRRELNAYDWTDLNCAEEDYDAAVAQAGLLLRSHKFVDPLADAIASLNQATTLRRTMYTGFDDIKRSEVMTTSDVGRRMESAHEVFTQYHDRLMGMIATKYFTSYIKARLSRKQVQATQARRDARKTRRAFRTDAERRVQMEKNVNARQMDHTITQSNQNPETTAGQF